MKSPVLLLAVVWGVLVGMLVLASAARWVYALASTLRAYRLQTPADRSPAIPGVVAATLLHSGPWLLAVAAFLAYYGLSRPHDEWLSWFFGGACGAPLLVAIIALSARRRHGNGQPETVLTADALRMKRTRAVWGMTGLFGGAMAAVTIAVTWQAVHAPWFVVFVVAVCMAGGYLFALITWQWKKSLLQAAEIERRKRAAH